MKPRIDPSSRLVLDEVQLPPPSPPPATVSGFVELCARTTFTGVTIEGYGSVEGRSTLDARAAWPGAGLPEEVVARAAVLGQDAIAIADVDTVSGVVRAHAAGREHGVDVIPGCELLLDEGSLVLLPMTKTGWANLCAILTEAKDGFLCRGLSKDDIEHRLDVVCAHAKDLQAIVWPPLHPRTATTTMTALQAAFGDRLSLGLSFQEVPDDAVAAAFVQTWHEQLGIAVVASARPVLVDENDGAFHDVLCAIRQHELVDRGGQRFLPNRRARLHSETEMVELLTRRTRELASSSLSLSSSSAITAMVARTRTIAASCTFRLGDTKYLFPVEHDDEDAVLREHTMLGAARRYPAGVPDTVRAQLDHELKIIGVIGVAAYFLTVEAIVQIAVDRGIQCQGRGSAANSAVCYCLGITAVNPAEQSMLFERFISVERSEPPDIDVDFEHERREEVIQEIYRRWGREHAAMVCEVISYRGKSSVRDVGKVFGLSDVVTSRIADLMGHSSFAELLGESRFPSMRKATPRRRELREVAVEIGLDVKDPAVLRTLQMSLRLQGHPRHLGIHVGGFVLTRHPITTLAPVEPGRMQDRAVLPFDKDDVETLGLFKMDVLGLGMLTCISKALKMVNASSSSSLSLYSIPADDPAVYDAICRADTIGVFQIESRAQMQMLPRLRPRTFYDLVIQVAIVRPGPIQGGMVHPYLKRRSGHPDEVNWRYPHPSFEPILKRTMGVPLFQEQVMQLAIVGAGYSPGDADRLRRDMAAWKKTGRLERHRERLIAGFLAHGVTQQFAEQVFEQIKGFGEYGFPESHAASFAYLVYASSWLKHHHPAVFACALLNSLPMGFYAPAQIVKDAQRHGITVRAADVTQSEWDCTLEVDDTSPQPALRLGLRLIKGLREDVARVIVGDRNAHGAFVDIADVVRRGRLDKRARVALAQSGAFDSLAGHRRAAMWAAMDPRPPLFARLPDEQPSLFPPSSAEVLLLDYATVGLSVDDHPMRHVRPGLVDSLVRRHGRSSSNRSKLIDSRELLKTRKAQRVLVAGLVIGRQRPGTADGTCFVTLEDEYGHINVIVWGRDYERWRATIVTHQFLLIDATIEREGTVIHAIARGVVGVSGRAVTGAAADDDTAVSREQQALPFASRDFH